MRVSRAEVLDALSKVRVENEHRMRAMTGNSVLLDQARVASEMLTGTAEWDVYLQRVQALIDESRRLLNGMADASALPNLTTEQVMQAHRHMLATKAKIEAWEQVLQLPKEIIGAATKSGGPASN